MVYFRLGLGTFSMSGFYILTNSSQFESIRLHMGLLSVLKVTLTLSSYRLFRLYRFTLGYLFIR